MVGFDKINLDEFDLLNLDEWVGLALNTPITGDGNYRLWYNNGKIVVDSNGKPILCDRCPCGGCPTDCAGACDTFIISMIFDPPLCGNPILFPTNTTEAGTCVWFWETFPDTLTCADAGVSYFLEGQIACIDGQWHYYIEMRWGGDCLIRWEGDFADATGTTSPPDLTNDAPYTLTMTGTLCASASIFIGADPHIQIRKHPVRCP